MSERASKPKPDRIEPRALSMQETADALGLGLDTIRDLIEDGELRSIRWGHRIIVPVMAIDEWIEEQLAWQTKPGNVRAVKAPSTRRATNGAAR